MRIVVIGLGVEGLLASWIFSQHEGLSVTAIGKKASLPSTSIVPIAHTSSAVNILSRLQVAHSSYKPRCGVLIQDAIRLWPRRPSHIQHKWTHEVQIRIREKQLGLFSKVAAAPDRSKRRVRLDYADLTTAILKTVSVQHTRDWQVDAHAVRTDSGSVPFDFCVITLPLWECRSRVWFGIGPAFAAKRTLVFLKPHEDRRFSAWDTILTPYTPHDCVIEVSACGSQVMVEAAGRYSSSAVLGDLNFLFPEGYELLAAQRDQLGCPQPLLDAVCWPEHVAPVGQYAEWRETATVDMAIDRSYELLRRLLKKGSLW